MPAAVPPAAGTVVETAPLRYIELQVGTGAAAKPGQEYTVHYTGWLRDGVKFDSSVDAGKPLKFVQGRRQVIAGWEMGFEGMKVGGKRRLFLPYALAYGENGRGKIPPKAELIFDVELLDAKDVPPLVAAAELLLPFNDLEKQVLALAKAIPEEKYSWRPGPGVRSFKEVFLHIVYGNQLLLNVAGNSPSREELVKQIEQNAKGEQDPATKEKIVGMLTESLSEVRKTLEGVRTTSALTRDIDFFGQSGSHGRRAGHHRHSYLRAPRPGYRLRARERHRAALVVAVEIGRGSVRQLHFGQLPDRRQILARCDLQAHPSALGVSRSLIDDLDHRLRKFRLARRLHGLRAEYECHPEAVMARRKIKNGALSLFHLHRPSGFRRVTVPLLYGQCQLCQQFIPEHSGGAEFRAQFGIGGSLRPADESIR